MSEPKVFTIEEVVAELLSGRTHRATGWLLNSEGGRCCLGVMAGMADIEVDAGADAELTCLMDLVAHEDEWVASKTPTRYTLFHRAFPWMDADLADALMAANDEDSPEHTTSYLYPVAVLRERLAGETHPGQPR